jgi:hypothetical protein
MSDDDLSTARGVMCGLAVSAVLWVLIFLVVYFS